MKNLKMYCMTMNPEHLSLIQKIGYVPVGLGNKMFSNQFITDKDELNISLKNSFYGEYTFHYWLWKNNKISKMDEWVGFCQYRKFWRKNSKKLDINNFNNLDQLLLKEIPQEYTQYETILGEEIFINKFKFSKFVKKNFFYMLKNPKFFFSKSKRTIKFHFDLMHGEGNLDRAIELLKIEEKKDFRHYVNTEVSFNPHNMFICKNKDKVLKYYESVFEWLNKCEDIFGFEKLDSYGLKRIYAFLAERYLSYWFKKYTKYITLPIEFKDLSDFL